MSSDWKKDLENKFNMIKAEGGEKSGIKADSGIRTNRGNSSRSNNSTNVNKDSSSTNNPIGSGSRKLFRGGVSEKAIIKGEHVKV